MKQYTTPEQTAKLTELGFEKPWRNEYLHILEEYGYAVEEARNFSIGELIKMLPEAICESHDDSCHYHLSMDTDACMWRVRYIDDFDVTLCATYDVDLINALYDVCVKLKEEGVI